MSSFQGRGRLDKAKLRIRPGVYEAQNVEQNALSPRWHQISHCLSHNELKGWQYEAQLDQLRQREASRFGDRCPPLPIDMDDVGAAHQ
eukprot:1082032-Pelagomonas_calceolata.AAC.3